MMRRLICPHCEMPLATCQCHLVDRVDNIIPVTILQHVKEARHPLNTARLTIRCLSRSQLICYDDESTALDHLEAEGDYVLLYPGDTSIPCPNYPWQPQQRLLVLDGTWRKTYRLLMSNARLQDLPKISLGQTPPRRYRYRKAQQPHQLSTLEAVALALTELESAPDRYHPLLAALDGLMDLQEHFRPPLKN